MRWRKWNEGNLTSTLTLNNHSLYRRRFVCETRGNSRAGNEDTQSAIGRT